MSGTSRDAANDHPDSVRTGSRSRLRSSIPTAPARRSSRRCRPSPSWPAGRCAGSPTARRSSTTRASPSCSTSHTSRRAVTASRSRLAVGVSPVMFYDAAGRARAHGVPGRHRQPRRVLTLAEPHLRPDRHDSRSRQPLVRRAFGRRREYPGSARRPPRGAARRPARGAAGGSPSRHAGRGPSRQPRARGRDRRPQPHTLRRRDLQQHAARRAAVGRRAAASPSPSSTPKASRCGSATRAATS